MNTLLFVPRFLLGIGVLVVGTGLVLGGLLLAALDDAVHPTTPAHPT